MRMRAGPVGLATWVQGEAQQVGAPASAFDGIYTYIYIYIYTHIHTYV